MRTIIIGLTLLTASTLLVVNSVQSEPIQPKSQKIRPQCLPPNYHGEAETPMHRLCASLVHQRLADLLWAEQHCKNENEVIFDGQGTCKELQAQAAVLKKLVVTRMNQISSHAEDCAAGRAKPVDASCLELATAQNDLKPIYDKVISQPH